MTVKYYKAVVLEVMLLIMKNRTKYRGKTSKTCA